MPPSLVHSAPPLAKPLNLPRFTFLCGPYGCGQNELAHAISGLDLDNSLGLADLEEPLRDATLDLFFEGYLIDGSNPDISNPMIKQKRLPEPVGMLTVGDWIGSFRGMLVEQFGADILARLAIKRQREATFQWERYLYRDLRNPEDMARMIAEHEKDNCLFINCGKLDPVWDGRQMLHLASDKLDERMAQLRRELGDLFE